MTDITLTNAHGTFTTTGYGLEQTITRFLPTSPNDLRTIMNDINPEVDYSDVHWVSEYLIMLADAKAYEIPRVPADTSLVSRGLAPPNVVDQI